MASLYNTCPYKAPPPGFEAGHVLIAPAVSQRVAGEPIPKQATRMSLESISEAAVRSTPEEPTEAPAESNSAEPATEPSATLEVSYLEQLRNPWTGRSAQNQPAGTVQEDSVRDVQAVQSPDHSGNADYEPMHTPDDLEPVTPSGDTPTRDEIPAGITTPVHVFLEAVEPEMHTVELSDVALTAAPSEAVSSSALEGASSSSSSSEDDAADGAPGSDEDRESVVPTAHLLIDDVWNSCRLDPICGEHCTYFPICAAHRGCARGEGHCHLKGDSGHYSFECAESNGFTWTRYALC